jgi:NADPH:quinone reductase-like Zn-dependent oxidoreductase
MKAVIINRYGGSNELQLAEVKKPQPKNQQVLIKIICSSINPVEVIRRKGGFRLFEGFSFPKILGSDFSGIVEAVGNDVKNYKIGDEVFGMSDMLKGGSYAEYIVTDESGICKKPENYSHAEAAGLSLVCLTTLQSFHKFTAMKPGQTLFINGASGGVGVYAVQLAKAFGMIVTATTSGKNTDFIKGLGADTVIDYTKSELTNINTKYDVFYDAYGNYSFDKIKHLLTAEGVYISTIPSISNFKDQLFTRFSSKKAKVVVVRPNGNDLKLLASLCVNNKVKPIIDSNFKLSEIQLAHEKLQSKRSRGKIIILHTDEPTIGI